MSFWRETGASSVMIARAAEWNTSIFRKEGKLPIKEVVSRYLDHAIEYDYTFVMVKYCVQNILGSEQETPKGKQFLASSTMRDLCKVFDKEEQFLQRQVSREFHKRKN